MMDDTSRIDALAEYGLCLVGNCYLQDGAWSYSWVCNFGDGQRVEATTIRDAIDQAVEAINRGNTQ